MWEAFKYSEFQKLDTGHLRVTSSKRPYKHTEGDISCTFNKFYKQVIPPSV
jgi:hypothetical protein